MNFDEYKKLRKMLIIGIIFAFITMTLGEMPIGWTVYPEADNEITAMIIGSGNLSLIQLACGIFFGGIGIPLQYYGYKAIADIISKGECKNYGKAVNIGAKAIAFFGGSVHIICVALMFLCRTDFNTLSSNTIPESIIDFTFWLVLPLSILFMAIYIPMTVAMIIPVIRGKTIFPKWAIIFNPLVYKGSLNIIAYIAPGTAFINSIRMSNMGLGSLITFTGLLILLRNYHIRSVQETTAEK